MTAARYKLPVGYTAMAGQKFGLNLLDLFGDDETDSSDSVGFLPEFATRTVEKGRGGVLGYKAPRTATRESTLQILPSAGAQIDFAQAPAPKVEEEKTVEKVVEPTRESLGSIAGKYGQSGLFGAQDYYKALEAGYKPEEVRSYLEQNPFMVAETNRPGQTGGLYEQIVRGNVTKPSEFFTPQEFLNRQISQTQTATENQTPTQTQTQAPTQTQTQAPTQTQTQAPTQTQTQAPTQTQTTSQPQPQAFVVPKAADVIRGNVGKNEASRLQEIAQQAGLSTSNVIKKAGLSEVSSKADVRKVLDFISSRAK